MSLNQKDKIAELSENIKDGVLKVFESEKYKKHLDVMRKFHNYSLNNQILIFIQNPNATLVKGYKSWKNDFDRQVKKGEKGIDILAPSPYTITVENEKLDEHGNKILDEQGNPILEKQKIKMNSYRKVTVFDISQTDGKKIEHLNLVEELKFNVENFNSFFNALKEISPVPVYVENINGNAKGYYSPSENKIVIKENMSQSQTIKTLIHEIAHAKLHNKENLKIREEDLSRNTREVEAESVAYIMSNYLGVDTSDYSFGYIASWSSNKDLTELISSLETIQKASNELIEDLKKEFKNHNILKNENIQDSLKNKIDEKIQEKTEDKIQNKIENEKLSIKEKIQEKQTIINQLKQEKNQKQQANRL